MGAGATTAGRTAALSSRRQQLARPFSGPLTTVTESAGMHFRAPSAVFGWVPSMDGAGATAKAPMLIPPDRTRYRSRSFLIRSCPLRQPDRQAVGRGDGTARGARTRTPRGRALLRRFGGTCIRYWRGHVTRRSSRLCKALDAWKGVPLHRYPLLRLWPVHCRR